MEEHKVEKSLDKATLLKQKSELATKIAKCDYLIDDSIRKLEEIGHNTKQNAITASTEIEIMTLSKQRDLSMKEREELANEMELIEQRLEKLKLVKKAICLSNIRYLLKENPGIKIGQIESDGDVSTGYTSKLEKPDNKSDPPIEYIAAAAKAFNVSIDTLLYVPLEETTASERYLLRFIEKLEKDTDFELMIWEREPRKALNTTVNPNTSDSIHPLFVPVKSSYDGYGNYDQAHFESRYFPDKYVAISADPYHATLTGTNSVLYILPEAIYDNPDDKYGTSGYELYILDSEEVTPICNTLQAHPAIAAAITKLYSMIKESSAHVKLNKKARNLIDAFMDPKPKNVIKVKPVKSVKEVNPFEELEDDGELPF